MAMSVTCSLPYIVIVHNGSNTSGFYLIRGTHNIIAQAIVIAFFTVYDMTIRVLHALEIEILAHYSKL